MNIPSYSPEELNKNKKNKIDELPLPPEVKKLIKEAQSNGANVEVIRTNSGGQASFNGVVSGQVDPIVIGHKMFHMFQSVHEREPKSECDYLWAASAAEMMIQIGFPPFVVNQMLTAFAEAIRTHGKPKIHNHQCWGLPDDQLDKR